MLIITTEGVAPMQRFLRSQCSIDYAARAGDTACSFTSAPSKGVYMETMAMGEARWGRTELPRAPSNEGCDARRRRCAFATSDCVTSRRRSRRTTFRPRPACAPCGTPGGAQLALHAHQRAAAAARLDPPHVASREGEEPSSVAVRRVRSRRDRGAERVQGRQRRKCAYRTNCDTVRDRTTVRK